MTYLNYFLTGMVFVFLYHVFIHKSKILSLLFGFGTLSFYLIKQHEDHHRYFLEKQDEYSYAKRNESFYAFFWRVHFKRRKNAYAYLDLLSLMVLAVFAPKLLVFSFSFIFHWELFEYWSHYALRDMTNIKECWSWNVLDKSFNLVTLNVGKHSKHHTGTKNKYPIIIGKSLFNSYLPLLPKKFFPFMDKCIRINVKKNFIRGAKIE